MNQIQVFENPEFGEIRTVTINGEPWFIGKDVAVILEYSNPRKAIIDHVDEEDKTDGVTIRDSIGRDQNPVCINESGLYSLILSSKLPKAKQFKHWVTSEVLPSIRKHGMYATPVTIEKMIESPEFGIKLLTELKKEKEQRKQLESKIEEDKPKVLFADAVETAKTSILVGELAKLLRQNGVKIGQNRLFEWLRQNGYLIARAGHDHNMPTQYSMERGLMEIKERTINNPDGSTYITRTPKITGKGQRYFINKFLGGESRDAG
jgi:anti-repressor protein